MIHLDTNICIDIINRRSTSIVRALRARAHEGVGVSAITVAELEHGVAKSGTVERNRAALQLFLVPLEIVPFDAAAAQHYGEIRAHLERRGTPIGATDLFIAAQARSAAATLVTNDSSDFARVPGLMVDSWATRP